MRVVARVAGAGSHGLSRIPYLDIKDVKQLCSADAGEHLDEAKVRAMFRDATDIQLNSGDDLRSVLVKARLQAFRDNPEGRVVKYGFKTLEMRGGGFHGGSFAKGVL